NVALASDQRRGRRHHGDEVELRIAPLRELLAVEERFLSRFRSVVRHQDALVHFFASSSGNGQDQSIATSRVLYPTRQLPTLSLSFPRPSTTSVTCFSCTLPRVHGAKI